MGFEASAGIPKLARSFSDTAKKGRLGYPEAKARQLVEERGAGRARYPGPRDVNKRYKPMKGFSEKMSLVTDGILIGGRDDAKNSERLREYGVTHVLNITDSLPNYFPGDFVYCQVAIKDAKGVDIRAHYNKITEFMRHVEEVNGRVLVHCIAGVSRSVTATLFWLVGEKGRRLDVAYEHIKACRPFICMNDSFKYQTCCLEVEKLGYSTIKHHGGKEWDCFEVNRARGGFPDPPFNRRHGGGGGGGGCIIL
mmetsp:Transcript_24463/g.76695  ORF Transcript_24463/g.76695 Transcript_24463/m.76695 type:complete len:252 (-) Transcript_24463:374-1129(-)